MPCSIGGMDATGGPMLKQARDSASTRCSASRRRLHRHDEQLASDNSRRPDLLEAACRSCPRRRSSWTRKAKFNTDPIIYAPFTYDAANS